MNSTHYWRSLTLAVVISLFAAPASSHAQAAMSPELQKAKASLAKYADPIAAVHDGYFSTLACIDFPQGAKDGNIVYPPGAMGIHFLNLSNVGPTLDPAKPQVLIYEPSPGGKLQLAAAEWFMPVQAAKGKTPSIFGKELAGPMEGHEPIMPTSLRHYDLHVWLWKTNPAGMFVSTNKALKCPAGAAYTVPLGEHHHEHY